MTRAYHPDNIAPPFGNYSHAVEIPAGSRCLNISGQVGVRPDGAMAEGFAGQVEWAWRNILAILDEADMTVDNLVKCTGFLTRAEDVAGYREARDRFLGAARPASTLLIVSALAAPDWLVEIEAVAAA